MVTGITPVGLLGDCVSRGVWPQPRMAATDKCLAQSNKSCTGGRSDQEQEPRNPSTRIDPSMNECCLLKSDCLHHFGWTDFDLARLDKKSDQCPVHGCSATLLRVPYRDRNRSDRTLPWCPEHGIRLHSGTFAYWNGD